MTLYAARNGTFVRGKSHQKESLIRRRGEHTVRRGFAAVLILSGIALMPSESMHADSPAPGTLVIIGGSERFSQREIWDEIVAEAGGPGAKIAVVPAANGDPLRKGGWVVSTLNKRGAEAFLVPLAWVKVPRPPAEIAADPEWVDRVRGATGVFFIGGSQDRITSALYTAEGGKTPLLDAIWDVYNKGGVIAGTSAGAAVMSRVMYRDAPSVLATLHRGVRMGHEIDRGLGFLDENWFVDQHCLVRGRFARALVAMHDQGFRYGLGIDENTAVVVRQGKFAKVVGYRGVLILDLSQAESDEELGKFNLGNVKLAYLDKGDLFDLETLEITPLAARMEDMILDPQSPEFEPETKHRLFFNDILANSTVSDLMCKLMENQHAEAYGLAFDGDRARTEAVDGFEFKFTRDEESIAWFTEMFGGDDYTVLNIRLDIRPIRISGPLYEVHTAADRTASSESASAESAGDATGDE